MGGGIVNILYVIGKLAQSYKNETEKSLLQKYLIGPNKLSVMILVVITPSTFGVFFSTHISICLE